MFKFAKRRDLETINRSLQEFRSGNLSSRVSLDAGAGREFQDIQNQINETLERAEELVESLKSGTLVLIHEMKYPFIASRSWMVRARNTLPDSILRDELDTLIAQLDEARATTEVMADISLQIASRHDRSNFSPTDLAQVCEDVVLELGDFARERGQFIRLSGSGGVVFGRDHLLLVAIRNLVHNACRHSPDNAVVDLICNSWGGVAAIEVRDMGAGMPDEVSEEITSDRSTLLAPFGSRKTKGGGLGLGLRLSKAIFKRHLARIEIGDRPDGQGTLVRVELPALQG